MPKSWHMELMNERKSLDPLNPAIFPTELDDGSHRATYEGDFGSPLGNVSFEAPNRATDEADVELSDSDYEWISYMVALGEIEQSLQNFLRNAQVDDLLDMILEDVTSRQMYMSAEEAARLVEEHIKRLFVKLWLALRDEPSFPEMFPDSDYRLCGIYVHFYEQVSRFAQYLRARLTQGRDARVYGYYCEQVGELMLYAMIYLNEAAEQGEQAEIYRQRADRALREGTNKAFVEAEFLRNVEIYTKRAARYAEVFLGLVVKAYCLYIV